MCAEHLSPQSSLNRRSSMAVSPESARILNPQSQVNVPGIDPLPHPLAGRPPTLYVRPARYQAGR